MDQAKPIGAILAEALADLHKPRKSRPCVICGERTEETYFGGVALCYPYDERGRTAKKCKWIYRKEA